MFKVDCLALLGRHVLQTRVPEVDELLRATFNKLQAHVSKADIEQVYNSDQEDPGQRTTEVRVQKLLQELVDQLREADAERFGPFIDVCRGVFTLAYWDAPETQDAKHVYGGLGLKR